MTAEMKRLYRSRSDRLLGGVCSGLGRDLNIDPTLMRLIFILLALIGGHGILVYLIMWLIVPEEPLAREEIITVIQKPDAEDKPL